MALTLSLAAIGCADVDSAMLFGGPDKGYLFTNDALPDGYPYQIDESNVSLFTLQSDDNGDKADIYCLYVGDPERISIDTIILFAHGNAPNLDDFWPKIVQLANLGGLHRFGVLAYDYRGYGKSEGRSTGHGTMMADINTCLDWLKAKGLESHRFVLLGESLGSIPGTYVAGESSIMKPMSYIFEVPQSTADAIAHDATGLSLPSSMLTDFNFDLISPMSSYTGALLWMHGTEDKTAPVENARLVFDAHNGVFKKAVVIEGAPHGLREFMGIEQWGQEIENFILLDL